MRTQHLQVNPGGTFAVTACGLLRIGGSKIEVRPPLAFAVTLPHLKCKRCVAAQKKDNADG